MEKIIRYKNQDIKILIDDADEIIYNQHKWHICKNKFGEMYIQNNKKQMLHRILLNAKRGEIVHHQNLITIDNRRYNLLKISYSEHQRIHNLIKSFINPPKIINPNRYKFSIRDKNRKNIKWK